MKRLFLLCVGLFFTVLVGCGGAGGSGGAPGKDGGVPDGTTDPGQPPHDGPLSDASGVGSGGAGSGGFGGTASNGFGGAVGGSSGAAAAGGGAATGGGGGTSSCGVPACSLDALRCQAGVPQQCVRDALGCAAWKSLAGCGAHQICTNGVCGCASEPRCGSPPTEGDFCPTAGGATFGHCAKDANDCLFVATTDNPCSNAQTCNASGVVSTGVACGCPADGTTVGTGCAHRTIGNTAADSVSESILSCESVGSCQVWRAQVNCGATGLTVATVSGVPVCTCRPAAGGTYYVDPSPGMAMYMNGAPTGANLPPACRLRSIKDALAYVAAGSGFDKVVVAHEFSSASPAPVHLNASTGESFPLIVPEGVTVTTAETPALNPEHFVVDIGGAGCAHCAVELEDGAVLSGLTIDASGATAAPNGGAGVASVISCAETDAAQTALLDHVKVVAQAGQTGILVGGSCALTASDVNVSGASLGVDVARTATGVGAEARLVSQRLGVTSTVSGSVGVQVGTGLDGGARSGAVLDGATILTRNLGLSVRGGTLSLDGGSVSTNNPATEEGVGAHIEGGTVVLAGTLVSGGAGFTGLEIAGGAQLTLQANATGATRVTTTLPASSNDSSDGVVLLSGAAAARLTIAGGTEISRFHTGVVVNDGSVLTQGTGMAMAITNNRGNGIELLGRTAGVTVTLSAGSVADNARTGVVVRTTVPSTIQNLQITGNGGDGVDLQRTQTAAQSGYRLVFASNKVSGNGGRGIALTGKGVGTGALLGGKVGVRLERNTVSGNAGVGVYVTESADAADGDDVTEVNMDSNDVGGNLTASATAPSSLLAGGVFFARSDATTRIVLGSYLGNRVHGNGRHEIAFDVAQDGGAAWNLSSNASAVDMATGCADAAKPNSVYCYDTIMGEDLGIAVSSTAIHVNVQNMHFQNAAPLAGRDYSLGIPMSEVTIPCAPQLCQ